MFTSPGTRSIAVHLSHQGSGEFRVVLSDGGTLKWIRIMSDDCGTSVRSYNVVATVGPYESDVTIPRRELTGNRHYFRLRAGGDWTISVRPAVGPTSPSKL